MAKMGFLGWLSYILLAVGGINWGIYGVAKFFGKTFDLVSLLPSTIANIIFVLVGIAGTYALFQIPRLSK